MTRTLRVVALLLVATLTACKDEPGATPPLPFISDPLRADAGCDWAQWGQNWAHTGQSCAIAQGFGTALATIEFDPFVAQEVEEAGRLFGPTNADLFAHYASPLVVGDDLYMAVKAGTYVSCNPVNGVVPSPCGFDAWDQQIWTVQHHASVGATLQLLTETPQRGD